MLDVSAFLTRYPEFAGLDEAHVQAALDDAALEIDVEVWGDKADKGQGLLAADLLYRSPFGARARTENAKEGEMYREEYARLTRAVASGWRVVL
jgi:hypothetical protein